MKNVKGFEGYFVNDKGEVFSNKRGGLKKLKTQSNVDGYNVVNLYKGGKDHHKRVARLVAEAYLPNPLDLPVVNHIDQGRTDDSLDNLEWCTYSENAKHAIANNLWTIRKGKDHHCYGKTTSAKQKAVVSKLFKGNEYQAKTYKIVSPEGKTLTIFNMHKFCRNYKKDKLHPSGMIRASRGERKSHKGFKTLLIS